MAVRRPPREAGTGTYPTGSPAPSPPARASSAAGTRARPPSTLPSERRPPPCPAGADRGPTGPHDRDRCRWRWAGPAIPAVVAPLLVPAVPAALPAPDPVPPGTAPPVPPVLAIVPRRPPAFPAPGVPRRGPLSAPSPVPVPHHRPARLAKLLGSFFVFVAGAGLCCSRYQILREQAAKSSKSKRVRVRLQWRRAGAEAPDPQVYIISPSIPHTRPFRFPPCAKEPAPLSSSSPSLSVSYSSPLETPTHPPK